MQWRVLEVEESETRLIDFSLKCSLLLMAVVCRHFLSAPERMPHMTIPVHDTSSISDTPFVGIWCPIPEEALCIILGNRFSLPRAYFIQDIRSLLCRASVGQRLSKTAWDFLYFYALRCSTVSFQPCDRNVDSSSCISFCFPEVYGYFFSPAACMPS